MSIVELHQLPETYHDLVGARLLIMGNGPSAASGNLGGEIDDFDKIIRINNYRTKGLESKVGSRTDIWVNGANQGLKKRSVLPENILVMIPQDVLMHKGSAIHKRIKKRLNTSDYFMLPLETIEALEKSSGIPRPTTGFFAIYFFYSLGLNVTIHGFDFFSGSKGHYFDHPITSWLKDMGVIKKAGKHDIAAEKALIMDLVAAGKINQLR